MIYKNLGFWLVWKQEGLNSGPQFHCWHSSLVLRKAVSICVSWFGSVLLPPALFICLCWELFLWLRFLIDSHFVSFPFSQIPKSTKLWDHNGFKKKWWDCFCACLVNWPLYFPPHREVWTPTWCFGLGIPPSFCAGHSTSAAQGGLWKTPLWLFQGVEVGGAGGQHLGADVSMFTSASQGEEKADSRPRGHF